MTSWSALTLRKVTTSPQGRRCGAITASDAPPCGESIPTGATRLAKLAEQHGWSVRITCATGTPIDDAGLPAVVFCFVEGQGLTPSGKPKRERRRTDELVVVESVAVRMSRHGDRVVGLWENGKFRTGLSPYRTWNSRTLKARITTPWPTPATST